MTARPLFCGFLVGLLGGATLAFAAEAAKPSTTASSLAARGLVDVRSMDPTIQVKLRYSSTNNFLHRDIYGDLESAYLQKEPAEMLAKAQKALRQKHPGCGLLVLDCARPRSVQRQMWEVVVGTEQQIYVANPDRGSIHNYGAAVDLTVVDEKGRELDMGTPFDSFEDLAQPRYEKKFLAEGKLTPAHITSRTLLRGVMEAAGFLGIASEWWHFDAFPHAVTTSKYAIIE